MTELYPLTTRMAEDNFEYWEKLLKGKDISLDFLNYLNTHATKRYQLENVRLGLQKGIPIECIKFYTRDCYDMCQVDEILNGFECCKDDDKKIELIKQYCIPELKHSILRLIIKGICADFTDYEITQLASHSCDSTKAYEKYREYLKRHRADYLLQLIWEYDEEKNEHSSQGV